MLLFQPSEFRLLQHREDQRASVRLGQPLAVIGKVGPLAQAAQMTQKTCASREVVWQVGTLLVDPRIR